MKRLISIILLAVVLCTTLAVCVSSSTVEDIRHAHVFKTVHTNHIGATSAYHQLPDGSLCQFTRVRLEHRTYCECGYTLTTFIANCAEQHSVCGGSYSCPY